MHQSVITSIGKFVLSHTWETGMIRSFLSAGSANIYAGKGHDVVYYDKTDTGYLTIDGTKATEAGNYTVTRVLGGDVKILQEVVKEQEVSVGKRTEKRNIGVMNSLISMVKI